MTSYSVFIKFIITCFIAGIVVSFSSVEGFAINYPSVIKPGKAGVLVSKDTYTLENEVLAFSISVKNNRVYPISVINKQTGGRITLKNLELFHLVMDNETVACSGFLVNGHQEFGQIRSFPAFFQNTKLLSGSCVCLVLTSPDGNIEARWSISLQDHSNYVQQRITFRALTSGVLVREFGMVELASAKARVAGTVDGSPIITEDFFFALEHPMGHTRQTNRTFQGYLARNSRLGVNEPLTMSSVYGVVPKGQMRRGFLYYLERERTQPYHQFLHYNSWFDISWDNVPMPVASCMEVVKLYGKELVSKRGVKFDGFLWDSGWDDYQSLWRFNRNYFPNGFRELKDTAAIYGAKMGLWMSPWGGYDSARIERLKYGQLQTPPFEINDNGFSLAGPNYYQRFKESAIEKIKNQGVAIFKLDGVGSGVQANGANLYEKDIDAFLKFIGELRQVKPDLFLSLTVGTWPSPYWLFYGNDIWRGGDDTGLAGEGNNRQQWITYKDVQTYRNIIQRAELYPLNSIMTHGSILATHGLPGQLVNTEKDVMDDVKHTFVCGTGLQELLMSPQLIVPGVWDAIATCSGWSRANADVMADVHWVGGNPATLDIYGWAAWNERKGILTLRNPSSRINTISIDIGKAFELPDDSPKEVTLKISAISGKTASIINLKAGKPYPFSVQPYEIITFETEP